MRSALTLLMCLFATSAFAQTNEVRARVTQPAPLVLLPDATRVPLRTAAVGTSLVVLSDEGDWLRVQFQDPQYGARNGYVQRKFVDIQTPRPVAMDLSVPLRPEALVQPPVQAAQAPVVAAPQPPAPTRTPLTRDGFWFNAGLGVGSAGCLDCSTRVNGASGNLSLGATLNPKWYAGVGTTGWTRSEFGQRLSAGTIDARFRWFPSLYNGFFLTFGAGLGHATFDDETALGLGMVFGLGYDFRVGHNVSLTPFYNGIGIANADGDMNWNQVGIGITVH